MKKQDLYLAAQDYSDPEEYKRYIDDQINDGFGGGGDIKYLNHLVNVLCPNYDFKDKKILDVGTRQFESYDYFIEKLDVSILGLDICKVAIEKAQKQNRPLIECDAHVMDSVLDHQSFDIIISFHAFEHMYDLPRVLKNCCTLLKDKGMLYYSFPMPSFNWKRGHWYNIPNTKAFIEMLEKAGFVSTWETVAKHQEFRDEVEMIGLAYKK